MSNEAPTDALRLVPRRAVYDWLRDDVPLNVKMTVMPHHIDALMDRLSAAAPASPLPGGGSTCQLCANKIEGWICQGCGSHFYENDAGALVLNTIHAAPTGDA